MAIITVPAETTLFVALTRPAMKWGVPYIGWQLNVGITTIFAILVVGNPIGLLAFLPFHIFMRQQAQRDPHFAHRMLAWYRTRFRSSNVRLWGGTRLQPSPSRIYNAQEMISIV